MVTLGLWHYGEVRLVFVPSDSRFMALWRGPIGVCAVAVHFKSPITDHVTLNRLDQFDVMVCADSTFMALWRDLFLCVFMVKSCQLGGCVCQLVYGHVRDYGEVRLVVFVPTLRLWHYGEVCF
ncbi:hypothetical protein GOP47_0013975 [Adiantum capillus-veneris]|uniref:Uncharacterized protein n=1 Tax=Adiantum capillus-veneris TaxID=13818 RepID=A0A9D4ZDW2_ADICA|nr:hypothetical protein GOP47_0013975 [Adiantum capillus-veneris]